MYIEVYHRKHNGEVIGGQLQVKIVMVSFQTEVIYIGRGDLEECPHTCT